MPNEFAQWNPPAVRLVRILFDAAVPFTTVLEGAEISIAVERLPSIWPAVAADNLSEASDGPWPPALDVRASWEGGATSFRIEAQVATGPKYLGQIGLRILTRSRGSLLWLNVSASLSRSTDGVAHLRALQSLLKRKDNTEQSDKLAELARRAQLPLATAGTLSLALIRVPEGTFETNPKEAFQRIVRLCLLKLPLFSTNARDVDGEFFMRAGAEDTNTATAEAFETVTATTHQGLMLPALRAIDEGASSPTQIEDHVATNFGPALTPGDQRNKANGDVLWRYNVRWALTYLKQRGEVENPARGQWALTPSGRERLAQERDTFDIHTFQTLQAKVPIEGTARAQIASAPIVQSTPPAARQRAWRETLSERIDKPTLDQLAMRLRPELGSTPSIPIARNVVFFGPPGTGKTWMAEEVGFALTGERPSANGLVRIVQFHPSYGYEDFVWGIRPVLSGEKAGFREAPGPFLTICKDALDEPDELFVLIIDEINRGDPARIFGELLYALEYRGREVTLASGGTLTVPSNLVVLGTMNSVDRSVAMVDYALRRRFAFLRVEPSSDLVYNHHRTKASFAASAALKALNHAIVALGDRELQLGHSYFLAPGRTLNSDADIAGIWRVDLAPQLAELFHGRASVLRDLERVWLESSDSASTEYDAQEADDALEAAEAPA